MRDVLARPYARRRRWRLAEYAVAGLVWVTILAGCGGAPQGVDVAADVTTASAPDGRAGGDDVGAPSADPTPVPPETSPSPTAAPDQAETALARPAGVPGDAQPAVVERIVDGDTFWVRVDREDSGPLAAGATHKVRLLEYDSPEATSSTECFGPEATERLASLTPVASEVWLESDVEDTDRYDRYLRYVWMADGTMVNLVMVREGFGAAVLHQPNDRHIDLLRAAEEEARAADVGMWGAPCDHDAPAPESQAPPRADGSAGNPWGTSSCDPAYDPCVPPTSEIGDLDCPDIRERYPDGVQVDHAHGDPHGLDRDQDGRGCE